MLSRNVRYKKENDHFQQKCRLSLKVHVYRDNNDKVGHYLVVSYLEPTLPPKLPKKVTSSRLVVMVEKSVKYEVFKVTVSGR